MHKSFLQRLRNALPGLNPLFMVLALSVLLRLGAALYMGDRIEALPGIYDQISYDALAQRVAAGHGFSFASDWWPVTRAGEPTAHWSYAMVLYLAGIYRLFGHHPLIARLLQAILSGVLLPWLVYRLSCRAFGVQPGPRLRLKDLRTVSWKSPQGIALLAAAWSALYGYFIYYGAALMTEAFYLPAVLWVLDCAQRLAQKNHQFSWALSIELGLAFGLTILLRQTFLLFVPFVLLWSWWAEARVRVSTTARSRLPSRRLILDSLLAVTISALMILPFTLYNQTRFQRFVLLNTNAGYVFFWSNHPIHGDKFIPLFTEDMPTYQELIPDELRHLDEAALEQALLKLGTGFVFEDPWRFIKLSISRIPEHFIFWPLPTSGKLSNVVRVASLGLALPFAVAGICAWLVTAFRTRRQIEAAVLLLLFLLVYSGVHLLTWAGIRYRLPTDPVLLVFAAYALAQLGERLRRPSRKGLS